MKMKNQNAPGLMDAICTYLGTTNSPGYEAYADENTKQKILLTQLDDSHLVISRL